MIFAGTKFLGITAAVAAILTLSGVEAGFLDKPSVATYWGQNSKGQGDSQKPLTAYCDDLSDVLVMAFTIDFKNGGLPMLNLANACEKTEFPGTSLLSCPSVGSNIKTCQQNGKTVLMSLGGAAGSYGFSNDADAEAFADTIWNVYGGGNSDTRPFGDAVIDGFDLDIEGGGSTGYAAMVKRLRTHFASDSSKQYYITGAPQCPFPDAMLGTVIDEVGFDAVMVQFYNNYCATASGSFNFNAWDTWAKQTSPNKDVKIMIGIPGSVAAAGSGYVPFDQLQPIVQNVHSIYSSFGGIMLWDASASYTNTDVLPNYQSAVASLLRGLTSGSPVVTTSADQTTASLSQATGTTTDSATASASDGSVTSTSSNDTTTTTRTTTSDDTTTATGITTSEDTATTIGTTSDGTTTNTETSTSDYLTSTYMKLTSSSTSILFKTTATNVSSKTVATSIPSKTTATDVSSKAITTDVSSKTNTTSATTDSITAILTTTNTPINCVSQDQNCSAEGQYACAGDKFAVCDHGKWNLRPCPSDNTCFSTTDGNSIYCAQGSGSNTCPKDQSTLTTLQKPKTDIAKYMMGPVAKPFKNSRIVAQFSVVSSDSKEFTALINARRFDQQCFGKIVTVQFKVADNIKITQVENGQATQNGNTVKVQVQATGDKSMVSIIKIKGEVSSGILLAPSANSMKFSS